MRRVLLLDPTMPMPMIASEMFAISVSRRSRISNGADLDPFHPRALIQLAATYEKAGRYREAMAQLQRTSRSPRLRLDVEAPRGSPSFPGRL